MSRLLEIIRSVVRQELAQQRGSVLGVVTTVFPHTAADDDFNYEANVQLKHEALELRKVPLAVNHVGVATPPRVGDLVLVQFINGDLNQPVITGRFYHADERPPLHQEDDLLFEQRVPDGTLNQLRFTSDGTIYLQRDVTKPEDNSEAKTSLKIDGVSGDLEIKSGEIAIVITNDTDIQIMADGKPIDVTCDTFTINGDLVVSNGANSTTISGNEITGG
ncbi:Actin cross-linking toxin VgrG1 [Halomicronema hongdechloris C2206]|uniref:Actin cross-linking toxin VgrG1 n=1 Tax=Halomicronema hongdechloris C2206 TaxID=1641165 RepID=A0A1Z3HPT9_9CYAN|nr:phage baseplate assembly protein V [Halomicronema hongdechloris]ASC72328.1 Actin cross-linking toxin VgrG1 [Halomicronema hongdechloris C2206]